MRRKLFGEIVSNDGQKLRRSLFSNSSVTETSKRRKLFSDTTEKVCQDCGNILKSDEFVCSNCGSSRFSYMNKVNSGESRETVDKTFSNLGSRTRRLLFSNCNCEQDIKASGNCFVCSDCGTEFTDESESPADLRCPNCGGNRVVKRDNCPCDNESCDDPDTCDATGETLKEFSGTTNEYGTIEKIFAERGLDLEDTINSGYAQYDKETDTVCFSENADAIRKLFSRLVISVTKELELDPVDSKEALIQRLSDSETVTPRAIIMIKKAHGINPIEEMSNSDSDSEDYIKDSGLENDIKFEHGGSTMSLSHLNNILKTDYNDAPDDILDKLVHSGIIDINGSEVKINK